MNLRHIQLEKKNTHDILSRKSREKERDLRALKKLELQMKVAEENLAHTKTIHEKVLSQVGGMPKDDGSLQKKKDDLAKEVEQTKRALATQVSHCSDSFLFHMGIVLELVHCVLACCIR